ncbi:uncharacterized protein DDB_G0283697-like [Helicoverpa armigera]|uniref:uncharacterized protein DDB_G0283697-like n=1 Tax=Helicoverpa armigera TaxID=29058 RepID=UPI003082EB63
MDDISGESSQFSLKDDIFSQYDDNFVTEDCLKSYESNIGSKNDEMREGNYFLTIFIYLTIHINTYKEKEQNVTQTKIIPTFGKQKNLKKDNKKPTAKPKKFVPPVKNNITEVNTNKTGYSDESLTQNSQLTQYLTENSSKTNDFVPFTQFTDTTSINDSTQNVFPKPLNETFNSNINSVDYVDNSYGNIGYDNDNIFEDINRVSYVNEIPHTQDIVNENTFQKKVSLPKRREGILGCIISNSLNILDNEDIIPTDLSQNSDNSSVKNLSQSQNQSFCSVTSLSKTYKNLDCNSFINDIYKIPQGNDFLDLFKNNACKKVKYVPMTIEYGDIGFNLKYSEYMKNQNGEVFERSEEEIDTCTKIINMYPKENSILKKKLNM